MLLVATYRTRSFSDTKRPALSRSSSDKSARFQEWDSQNTVLRLAIPFRSGASGAHQTCTSPGDNCGTSAEKFKIPGIPFRLEFINEWRYLLVYPSLWAVNAENLQSQIPLPAGRSPPCASADSKAACRSILP